MRVRIASVLLLSIENNILLKYIYFLRMKNIMTFNKY